MSLTIYALKPAAVNICLFYCPTFKSHYICVERN